MKAGVWAWGSLQCSFLVQEDNTTLEERKNWERKSRKEEKIEEQKQKTDITNMNMLYLVHIVAC
jgi:hypothetical protein